MSIYAGLRARVVDVHDGDTVHLDVELPFGMIAAAYSISGHPRLSCRVWGINAPELSTEAGKAAAEFARTLLPVGELVGVVSHSWDKFGGRWDGEIVLPDGRDFGTSMVNAGHAVPYAG